jgi:ABC-type Fe3+-siderophore transport system permease subunit
MPCCSSCVADNEDALWLPQNSVRAIIAIIITTCTFGVLTFLIVYLTLQAQYPQAIAIAGIMSTALSSVVTTYFANRSNQAATKQITDVQAQHIATIQAHNLQLLRSLSKKNHDDDTDNDHVDNIDSHVVDVINVHQ